MTPAERETLSKDRWFGALPPERQALLLDIGHVRAVRDRALLYGVGDEPDGLWAVLQGEVRLVSYPAVGMELVGLIVGTGGWFGELSVLDGGPRPHDAICFGPARVVNLPMDEVSRLAAARPEICRVGPGGGRRLARRAAHSSGGPGRDGGRIAPDVEQAAQVVGAGRDR